ncbi:MAG: PIN domain-containing protein [Chloroflexi bacterium]|nr:MAG: PIN domain-containing protein [Chloroflexota bacterium]RPH63536.1 MAG: PIN domain-containing protein [Chloroflexota bacterium]
MAQRPKVFLDTSALFAGVWSGAGGARQILKLAEAGLLTVSVSPQVLAEIENNLRRKAPDLLGKLAVLLDRLGLIPTPTASGSRYEAALALTGHPGDARVLADAWESGADFFVTLDRQHFLGNESLRSVLPFPLGTPGDFLLWYRQNTIEAKE